MSKLRDAKIFGGIGAILLLLSFIPLLPIIGIVFLFIAVKYIADETKDHDIFKNYLYSFIFNIIALVALAVILIISFVLIGFTFADPGQFSNITNYNSFIENFEPFLGGFLGCGLAFFIAWIFVILGALYLKKSYEGIAERTKVDLFKTTGLVNFIGAITLIIFIGVVILLIARILEIASYLSLPDSLSKSKVVKDLDESNRRCPNCGRIIPEDAKTCPYCSKKFE